MKKQEEWQTILTDDITKQAWLGSDSESSGEEEESENEDESEEDGEESPMDTD